MSMPGIGFLVMVGTALAGMVYLIYQRNNPQNQYTYQQRGSGGACYDTQPVNIEPMYDTPPTRRRKSDCSRRKECTICLEALTKNLQELPCQHIFHAHCINMWLRENHTCPICRVHC